LSHKNFYKNTIWQYGLQLTKYIFPLLVLPYLTRVLERDGYAVYAYVLSFMTFIQVIADFGFNLSGTKRIADTKDKIRLNHIVGSITQARIFLCVLLGVAVLLMGQFIQIIRENFLYAILTYLAVCGKALVPDFVFQGKENMAPLTMRYFVSKGISTGLTFVFVHSISDILWIPLLDIVSSIIALAWSFVAMKKLFGIGISAASLSESFRDLKISSMYCISNLSSTAFSGFSTILIGILIADRAQISYWSVAMTAVSAIQSLYSPIINSLYPHMVVSFNYDFAKKMALIALPLVMIGTVLFVCLANPIVLFLGGKNYLAGSYILKIVSPVLLFSFYGMYFGWPVLGAAGKVNELTLTTIISSAFNIVILILLAFVGWISIIVIAIMRVLTEALMCSLRLYQCHQMIRQRTILLAK